jgi:hypothetical protein
MMLIEVFESDNYFTCGRGLVDTQGAADCHGRRCSKPCSITMLVLLLYDFRSNAVTEDLDKMFTKRAAPPGANQSKSLASFKAANESSCQQGFS